MKMKLLEEYYELIERDSREISILWKLAQMIFHLLSAISGYGLTIFFYVFWKDIFGGHCPVWAHVEMIHDIIQVDLQSYTKPDNLESILGTAGRNRTDWRKDIFVNYEYEKKCETYFIICFCSCIFGVTWSVFFFMCGKGGYATSIFFEPWRIVPVALLFTFVPTITTIFAVPDLEGGYLKFSVDMENAFYQITNSKHLPRRNCPVIQEYVEVYNHYNYDVCKTYLIIEILSWIMMWSWSGGFIILVIRVLIVNDFRLLKIKVYEVPVEKSNAYSSSSEHEKDNDTDNNDVNNTMKKIE